MCQPMPIRGKYYVDNFIFWSKNTIDINNSATQLHELVIDLEQEDDAAGFLGVMSRNRFA
jgi:hypothetical protein